MAIISTAEIAKIFDEIRDQRDAANARAAALEAVRDAERKERESLYPILDEKSRLIKLAESERDEWADMFNAECAKVVDLRRQLEQAQNETDRLKRFLQTIVNIGDKDKHAAFDGERWREMRHCANQAINTGNDEYIP